MLFACAVTACVPSSNGIDLRTLVDFVTAPTAAEASAIFMDTARTLVPEGEKWQFASASVLPSPVFPRAQDEKGQRQPPTASVADTKTSKRKRGAAVRCTDLVRRFTDKQAELAAKISNDIAEDIDCGESRKTLRMVVAYFADVACVESQRRADAESKLAIFRWAKGLMDAALPPNDKDQATASTL